MSNNHVKGKTKSILYIGAGVPWQGGAGHLVRQNMFLKVLLRLGKLNLVLFNFDQTAPKPPFPCNVTSIEIPSQQQRSRLQRLTNDLFSPMPRLWGKEALEKVQSQVQLLQPEKFDLIFAYRIDFAYLAGVEKNPRLILDIDDPEHRRREEREKLLTSQKLHWRTRLYIQKLRSFELNIAKNAQLAFVCQQKDAVAFKKPYPLVVPNCVEIPQNCHRLESKKPKLLFVGNMKGNSSANHDGIKWFLENIFPIIYEEKSDTIIRIVGKMNSELKNSVKEVPNLEIAGFVDNLEQEYQEAWMAIAPIRFGTGTRIKILEAFAHKCPVVSTVKGCEGIEITNRENIFVEKSLQGFAYSCLELIDNPQKRKEMGKAGQNLVLEQYSYQKQENRLYQILNTSR